MTIVLVILGCMASALLLLYALRLIFRAEYQHRIDAARLDEAIGTKWSTGMTPEQLAELDRTMWRG